MFSVRHIFHICGKCDFVAPEHPPTDTDANGDSVPYLMPTHHFETNALSWVRVGLSAVLTVIGSYASLILLLTVGEKGREERRKAVQQRYLDSLEDPGIVT